MKVFIARLFVSLFCFNAIVSANPLSQPDEIKLSGLERKASLNSALGPLELRWTRESEKLFGKTPERSSIDAFDAVAKALRQSSLPAAVKFLKVDWNVIFLSREISKGQIPAYLKASCHPGWMTPPANIYIAAEKVAGECMGQAANPQGVADSQLARVLIHEIGHAVEYIMAKNLPLDRARSEGFATFFEVFAARYSSLLSDVSILNEQKALAQQKLLSGSTLFLGGAADYSLAAAYFHLLLQDRPISELSRLYDLLNQQKLNIPQAVQKLTGWSDKELSARLLKFSQSRLGSP